MNIMVKVKSNLRKIAIADAIKEGFEFRVSSFELRMKNKKYWIPNQVRNDKNKAGMNIFLLFFTAYCLLLTAYCLLLSESHLHQRLDPFFDLLWLFLRAEFHDPDHVRS